MRVVRVAVICFVLYAVATVAIRRTDDEDPYDDYDQHVDEPTEEAASYPSAPSSEQGPDPTEPAPPKQSFLAAMAPVIAVIASRTVPALETHGSSIPMLMSVMFAPRVTLQLQEWLEFQLNDLPDLQAAAVQCAVTIGVFGVIVHIGKNLGHFQQPGKDLLGTDAKPVDELEYVQGEPVDVTNASVKVIEFWAGWCAPCQKAIPHLNSMWKQLSKEFGPNQLQLVGVNLGETADKVKEFIQDMDGKMEYPVALDPNKSTSTNYPNGGIPHAYVVDKAGKICWAGNPLAEMKELEQVIRTQIKVHTGEKSKPEKTKPTKAGKKKQDKIEDVD